MKFKHILLFALALSFPISGCKQGSSFSWNSLLTAVKADSSAPSQDALMAAVRADDTQLTRNLIRAGADVNTRTSPNGWSALHYAVRNGNSDIVELLLNAGADPNYMGTMEGQSDDAISLKPLTLAEAALDLVNQVPPNNMEATLRQVGLDDPAVVNSMKDSSAAYRYRKVIQDLAKVTKDA
jgi:ankyrin repeat protein